jgi:hypothetical protein
MTADNAPPDATVDASRERRRGVQQACTELETALARPAGSNTPAWASSLGEALDNLREAFRRHVEQSESSGGFLPEITADAPRLAHAVDQIRREHVEIVSGLERLKSKVATTVGPEDVESVRDESLALVGTITAHRFKGADLIYDAYTVDIEAGD